MNEGLADSSNITSLVSYSKAGSGRITTNERTVIGENSTVSRTQFTAELAVGDTITIGTKTRRVHRVLSDLQLEIEAKFSSNIEQPSPFQVTRVLAGTLGSGIFRLKPDAAQRSIWEPVANNPADLNVRCLAADSNDKIFAGTVSGGIFQSIDEGNL